MYRLNVQVTAYGRQTVPDRGGVRSCDPLKLWGLQSYHWNGCTQSHHILYTGYINSSNRMTYHQQKGRGCNHVTVLKFCRFPWCKASHGFVSDSWATCSRWSSLIYSESIRGLHELDY